MKRTHQTFSAQEKNKLLREIANSRGSTRETQAQLGISRAGGLRLCGFHACGEEF